MVSSVFHVNFLDEAQSFLRLDLSQLKLEYLNHLYSKFWYKNNKLMTCSIAREKGYKWHKMNSEQNEQKIIRGVDKCYLCRNSSHVLMLPLQSTVVTNFGTSYKKIATYDTVENLKLPLFTLHI